MSRDYWKNVRDAKEKYGEAKERPQDKNRPFRKEILSRNLELTCPQLPDMYETKLRDWCSTFIAPSVKNVSCNMADFTAIDYVNNRSPEEMDNLFVTKLSSHDHIAVDFEFTTNSYDGFICITSIATPRHKHPFVIESVFEHRKVTATYMQKILEDEKTIKIFCGCDNDVLKMQYDWDSYPIGVIDLQDMFVVLKQKESNAFDFFKDSIMSRMRAKNPRGAITELQMKNYYYQLEKPGLDFLITAFFKDIYEKDTISTHADWLIRPLPNDLLKYSGADAYFTIRIFHLIYEKIGEEGLREAAFMSIKKLNKTGSLPNYKKPCISDSIASSVKKWREYLAINLDKKPDDILHITKFTIFCEEIKKFDMRDESFLENIIMTMRRFLVGDDHHKSAKLLKSYILEDEDDLSKNIVCHDCHEKGHVARFCPNESKPTKEFFNKPENYGFKQNQGMRRWRKYCENTGKDPNELPPWAKKKGG